MPRRAAAVGRARIGAAAIGASTRGRCGGRVAATGRLTRADSAPRPRARWHAAVAAGPLISLATGVSRTMDGARPGTSSDSASAASSPSGVEGSPDTIVYATPSSKDVWASDTATPGPARARARTPAARALPSPKIAGVVGLDPVDRAGQRLEPARRTSDEPRNRSNGCGMPTSPPWARTCGDRLRGRQARAGSSRSRKSAIRSPVGGPDLLADDDRQARRGRRGSSRASQGAIDPVVVRDGEVRQAARGGGPNDRRGRRQASRSCAEV